PCFVPGFAWTRDRVESPLLLAGLDVIGGEKPPNPELASRDPDHDGMIDDERRPGHRVAFGGACDQRSPDDLSIVCVDRDQIPVEAAEKERGPLRRTPPVHPEFYMQAVRNGWLVFPNRGAGLRIQGEDVARIGDHEYRSVDHQRRGLDVRIP